MGTVQDAIAGMVRAQLPPGIILTTHDDPSLELWIEDAAEAINSRRRYSTVKEVSIDLVTGTQTYALPTDCDEVQNVIPKLTGVSGGVGFTGFPIEAIPGAWPGPAGRLPSGQRITGSIDLIQRQEVARAEREFDWRTLGSSLVLDFPVDSGQVPAITVVYSSTDRSVETLPKRHWDPIVKKCRAEALSVFIDRSTTSGENVGDALVRFNLEAIRRQKGDLLLAWNQHLAGILPESRAES